ncbi:MAG: menaquinone biosynthetic enzyme MqnA/MqnD family protein [Gemmatimonadales bacterium]
MRVGRIGYINCFPIYGALDRGIVATPAELVTGTPAELNELLLAGEVSVSVVSAVEYARNASQLFLLPDLAISSDGPVRSVGVFCKRPISEMTGQTVLVSQSSRTSVLLFELLCKDYWHIRTNLVEARAEAADLDDLTGLPHEGLLVIGDAALHLKDLDRYEYFYDLGLLWKQWTGQPFVFAVWAARRDAPAAAVKDVHAVLLESRAWGLANLDVLADEASRQTGIDAATCGEYLEGLDYALSYAHLEGLTGFFRRLVSRGIVRDDTLSFLSVA